MSYSPEKNSNPNQFQKPERSRSRQLSLPESFFREEALKHVIFKMQLQSLSSTTSPSPSSPLSESDLSFPIDPPLHDSTSLLSDELLLIVLSKLPLAQYVHNSLVCKRWLYLHGRLVQSLKILDWGFLDSGRVVDRFLNLTDVDLVRACIRSPRNSGILVTRKTLTVHIDSLFTPNGFIEEGDVLRPSVIDQGLKLLGEWYPNLRRLVAIGASENGLQSIAEDCQTLQELELHCCGDMALKGISGCRNLQIVKLIGCVDGFYSSVISDIGLTILAQGCTRLVKLELSGCEGSYDGIKAIGQCCQMLEELTLCDHRMDGGWLAALSYCGNLKTLRLRSCKIIDSSPGPDEHLGSCPTIEELHLQQCLLRDKHGVKALFLVCEAVRDVVFQDCWGLADDVFSIAAICRRVKLISFEGCSLLTTGGLESVVLSWKELQRLRVVSCNNVKDSEVTPALASLFSILKELKWRPDSKSLLISSLAGTGVGRKGGRFFKRLKP
ncbi:F-box domain containing protein [Parasponia andersonii]|uniref:F-box domain containing protein n=1 Tax=Parasponia andersonii TaxID=3476 RepID=A0A2P5CJF0_PARAD|nr:F-box domain containing protein [Parasponia andersonii]